MPNLQLQDCNDCVRRRNCSHIFADF